MSRVFCNGIEADPAALAPALTNYGHFTSMQVRGGAVQGLDLHLQRLQQGTQELFSTELDLACVQDWMRSALGACALKDATLRITVFSRQFDFRQPLRSVTADVLVGVSAPVSLSTEPRALHAVRYQRDVPHLKHVGTFPLFQHRRLALQAGFDDALFVTAEGRVSEGTTWNIAFWDGREVVWPQAAALRGTAECLLMAGLTQQSVPQVLREVALADVGQFRGAVACNASGLWPVARIGVQEFDQSQALLRIMQLALDTQPWQAI